ncbi:MAG: hypothetical protein U1C47_10775 [Hydrogenophaga sp.]|nr:hypothetical protein [Hydrogenophaga sp.]
MTALLLLVPLQWLITWLSVRHPTISKQVKSKPRLFLLDGCLIPSAMTRERETEVDLHAALRVQGLGCVADAAAVVMETDGSLIVIPQREGAAELGNRRSLEGCLLTVTKHG